MLRLYKIFIGIFHEEEKRKFNKISHLFRGGADEVIKLKLFLLMGTEEVEAKRK